uniref:Transmembrane protein n=1 Tax=Ascaris lumbricoides TaxID=6252 RepID=A0A0M3HV92_ASCLU
MATSSSRKKFVDDGRDNVTAGTDISNITHVVATKDNENVTKQLFGMSSNYQRNADEKNFTIVAEPENTEGAVKKIEPGEMPLSPSSSPRAHSKMPSSISSSTLGPEEPPSREIKGVEVQETSTPIEQRKMAGGEGNKLHQTPTEQTKQKNESFRWIFFGVAGFSLMAAIASATLLALTYTGVILAPPRKPTPPNVLPPAVL